MWRSRIFWRTFGVYSLLLVFSLGLLGWLLLGRMESQVLAQSRRGLEMKTLLIGELAARQSPDERQGQIEKLGKEIKSRITLIADDGKVLADSMEKPEVMENHRDRPEVWEAQNSGIGASTRYSETVHQMMLYVARKTDAGPVRFVRIALPLGDLEAEIRWLHRIVWSGVGLTLVLALIFSLFLARRITAPLVELAAAADALAGGEYGKRVLISSTDEIGALARSFNEMSQACAIYFTQMDQDRQRLRAIFRSMVEGVLVLDAHQTLQFVNEAACQLLQVTPETAQGRKIWQVFRHRQLSDAVSKILASDEPYQCELEWGGPDRKVFGVHGARLPGEPLRGAVLVFHDMTHLRKLERVRQDFVANVSHELKTPLAAIQAMVETLIDGAIRDPDHNVRFLERIRENAERLHRLVQDLLTLGRIESGQETMEITQLPLEFAVDACISRHGDRAQAKGLLLEKIPPEQPLTVLVDEENLAEILDNLVDNAIKYTTAGRITLAWNADGDWAVLQVSDTGVGIPDKDLPRIFERFYRVDKARSRELGGTGLGLSIVKHLVQGLGGTITATSQLGEGSTFSLRLPLARVSPPPPESALASARTNTM